MVAGMKKLWRKLYRWMVCAEPEETLADVIAEWRADRQKVIDSGRTPVDPPCYPVDGDWGHN
jgi:hypothetical protein